MVNLSYRFSSPRGDIVADESMLGQKFAVGPMEYHQFITLGDFFDCVRRFLLPEKGSCLPEVLARTWQRPVKDDEIEGVVVRYEKYGTLYQICSIDVSAGGASARMCASVAFSGRAKQTLEREFELLSMLEEKKGPGFLPRAYKKDLVEVGKAARVESLLVVLLEWFEGYEEWHFQGHNGSTRAFLWDMREGHRFLSEAQTFDIVSQASRILTLYYDVESRRRIAPWHHGGGDFIVRASEAGVDLRLITARGYEPMRPSEEEGLLEALVAFCMETVTKMRLDKWEGMGESTWADRFVPDAALHGFFEALKVKEARGEMSGLSAAEVLQRMKSFDANQLRSLVKRQFVDSGGSDLSDYMAVRRHLDVHASEIFAAIQSIAEP
jgi:hypothetical protein